MDDADKIPPDYLTSGVSMLVILVKMSAICPS